jgi:hypothetical protein
MRALIPSKTISFMTVYMTAWKNISFKNITILMT